MLVYPVMKLINGSTGDRTRNYTGSTRVQGFQDTSYFFTLHTSEEIDIIEK
jgi:hypothetical protein